MPVNIDLDTKVTTGIFSQNANAEATTALHYPVAQAGLLEVFAYSMMIHQRYWVYNTDDIYYRAKYDTGAWSAWVKGANVNDSITGNAATATTLQTARTINGVSFNGGANITINAVDSTARIASSEKGAVNGVATLDASGKVPAAQLPSYVDDVIEATNLAAFPVTGESGKIYVALDTNKTYRWSGSAYVYITSGAVDSVAGKTGVVTLTKGDVGLGSVDNTTDLAKPVSTATTTALNLKANLATTYTKTEVDTLIAAGTGTVSTATTTALNLKANLATTYTKTEVDTLIAAGTGTAANITALIA